MSDGMPSILNRPVGGLWLASCRHHGRLLLRRLYSFAWVHIQDLLKSADVGGRNVAGVARSPSSTTRRQPKKLCICDLFAFHSLHVPYAACRIRHRRARNVTAGIARNNQNGALPYSVRTTSYATRPGGHGTGCAHADHSFTRY